MCRRNLLFTALFTGICLASSAAFGQLVVDGSPSAEDMAEALVGEGVSISDVELDCPSGAFGF